MEHHLRKQRSRILIHPDRRYMVMANFKCGFSSLNNAFNLKTDRSLIHQVRTAEHLEKWISDSKNRKLLNMCQRVLMARSPYERSLSFFFSWIVNPVKEHRAEHNQAHLTLRKVLKNKTRYREIVRLIQQDQLIDAWRIFVRILPKYYRRDWHTQPQHWLYSSQHHQHQRYSRTPLINFHHIFKLEDLGDDAVSWFTHWMGKPLPHHYQTQNRPKLYRQYFDAYSYQIINRLYHHDFIQLDYPKEGQ